MSSAARSVPEIRRSAKPGPAALPLVVLEAAAEPVPPPSETKTKDPMAILSFARALLSAPERWLHGDQYHSADDGHGHGCKPWEEIAARWDIWGALAAAHGTDKATDEALGFVALVRGLRHRRGDFLSVTNWHDAPERTHAEVLHALDDAIALASRAR